VTSKLEKARRMELRRSVGYRKVEPVRPRPKGAAYLIAHACFDCRRSYKLVPRAEQEHRCPSCGGKAYEMGRSFRAPAKVDIEQWRKVQALFAHGFRFFSCRSSESATLPERSREVERFVRENPQHPLRVARPRPSLLPRSVRRRHGRA
jgi:DNA-directed RNA polymerase subunit RPC12/RpoP